MVVAYAASGRPPFGRGPADALYYRVVHQRPHLPEGLPAPLDALVPAALVKDPRQRPSVADLVTGLESGEWPPRSAAGNGPEGATEAPTTGSVPTIVAAGWGPRPCRPGPPPAAARAPDGGHPQRRPHHGRHPRPGCRARPPPGPSATAPTAPATGRLGAAGAAGAAACRRVPRVAAAAPAAAAPMTAATALGPKGNAVPGGALRRPDATLVAPPTGPTFFYAGAEHATRRPGRRPGRDWDDAVDQLFVARDPVWLGDLRTFLRARGLAEAEGMVARRARDRGAEARRRPPPWPACWWRSTATSSP